MRKTLSVLLVTSLVLSACGWRDSRLNPGNWFDKSEPVETGTTEPVNPLIPAGGGSTGIFKRPEAQDSSVAIPTITDLAIERTPSGAIIRATGEAARLGAYGAHLRLESDEEAAEAGVLEYSFRVSYPESATPQGTAHARKVVVARSLNKGDLEGVRVIRVVAAQNARESRRR